MKNAYVETFLKVASEIQACRLDGDRPALILASEYGRATPVVPLVHCATKVVTTPWHVSILLK